MEELIIQSLPLHQADLGLKHLNQSRYGCCCGVCACGKSHRNISAVLIPGDAGDYRHAEICGDVEGHGSPLPPGKELRDIRR